MNLINLPEHIDPVDLENLISTLAAVITEDQDLREALDICNLDPTPRAVMLASEAAINVILAHEIGQEVGNTDLGG